MDYTLILIDKKPVTGFITMRGKEKLKIPKAHSYVKVKKIYENGQEVIMITCLADKEIANLQIID